MTTPAPLEPNAPGAFRGYRDAGLVALNNVTSEIAAVIAEAGYQPIDPALLQPAALLLDLYGEDVRARAFVISDPVAGEMCLRPDFTVPVCLAHLENGGGEARYGYMGRVFRRQTPGSGRPAEYLQTGVELIGAKDHAAADAEVFTLIRDGLKWSGAGETVVRTGDLGVAFALLDAVDMPARWRAALKRHFWRPARFHQMLAEYAGEAGAPGPERAALLDRVAGLSPAKARSEVLAALKERGIPALGARTTMEIAERLLALAEDRAEARIPAEKVDAVEAALAVNGPSGAALARLRALTAEAGLNIAPALDAMEARLAALEARGVDAAALPFDAAFGRLLEYYDGFVFEFAAPDRPDDPPLGGGGRYDAMLSKLGGNGSGAVGGMIRPEAVLEAQQRRTGGAS